MKKVENSKKKIVLMGIFVFIQAIFCNTIFSLGADNSKEQVIEEGTYIIKSSIDDKYVLDVSGASKENGTNVALYEYHASSQHQKFQIKYVGNGYYKITAIHSNKVLDVEGSGTRNETNVEQYEENNPLTKNQKWKIIKNADNTYSFVSECNGLYLDTHGGIAKNGINIQVYEGHGGKTQKFKLEAAPVISNGTYAIKSSINDKYTFDVAGGSKENGVNVSLYEYSSYEHQKFKVEYLENGYYKITAAHSGKALDVTGSGKKNETNVEQYEVNNPISKNQKWKILKNEDDTYSFFSECNGLYLDANGGGAKNGTNIQVYEGHGGKSQRFKLVAVSSNATDNTNNNTTQQGQTIKNGVYSIETGISNNYVIDVEGGSRADGANIQIFEKQSANRQKFRVTYLGDGCYTITAVYSNKVIDVNGSGMVDETNVLQFTPSNPIGKNQRWKIKEAGNGYYYIISDLNGLYLDVYTASARNGNNIQLYTGHGGNSQKFKFVEPMNILDTINTSKYPGYKEKINALMEAHPGWNFELLYTGLKLEQAVSGEAQLHARNLIPNTSQGDWICSVCGTKPYDNGSWYCASEKAIAYYMDPRNFLDETNVFQFQDLNEYIQNVCSLSGIQVQVNGTFLQNHASSIDNACRNQNVNSYYIVTRVLQEQGRNGTTIGKGMDGGDGKTYYNPFNIGASGNGWNQIYTNALATAKSYGWDSMQKALEGGITFCKKNWLDNYQNTLYQNKFDIDLRSGASLYTHQYMQNLMAAYSEARTLKNMYANTGKLDSNFTFVIPMYENINEITFEKPSNNQETSPINVRVTANGGLWIRKEATTASQNLRLIESQAVILSVQRGINSNWHKVITTDGLIGYMSGDYLKQVDDVINCNDTATVKTDGSGCNMRVGPSTNLDKITALSDGTKVTVINQGTYNHINGYNWCRVRLSNGLQGFMPINFLAR